MRITGGIAKGRILSSFKGRGIRPTSEKVREAIFNVVGQDLTDCVVLDLFAGTGILSLEALSRGAKRAIMVEVSQKSIKVIKKNIELCGFGECCTIIRHDIRAGIPVSHPALREQMDLVFLDPPYGRGLEQKALEELSKGKVLGPGANVVVESSKDTGLPNAIGPLEMVFERIYGDTKLMIFEKKESEHE